MWGSLHYTGNSDCNEVVLIPQAEIKGGKAVFRDRVPFWSPG